MGTNRVGPIDRLINKRTTFGWVFVVLVVAAVIWRGPGSWVQIGIGFFVAALGVTFRTLAAGIIKKNEELASSGPYAWCRHPLYFGSFLLSLGIAVAAHNAAVWIYLLLFFPFFYVRTMKKEEAVLAAKFADRYEAYRRTTPAFCPRPGRLNLADFRWQGVFDNHEPVNWAVILLLLIVMIAKKCLTQAAGV